MSSRCPESAHALRWYLTALCVLCLTWPLLAAADGANGERTLRVCAHPDNLPFSAQDESGFDNKVARVIADELHAKLEFVWFQPQHGLVRKTLTDNVCDALIGLPQGYEGIAASTPYYRSRYVFVYPRNAAVAPSFDDPAFLQERIGVQLIGDDMAATPPGHVLAAAHAAHVIGFPVYGDGPAAARLIDAIASGDLDAAVAWGPAAGFFAAKAARPLAIAPAMAPPMFVRTLPFEFSMVVAVRKKDEALKKDIDAAITRRQGDIDRILASYHVPRADRPAPSMASTSCAANAC